MAIKTQGTHLYAIDPSGPTLIAVGCVTSIDGIDTTIEQIDVTCLGDSARQYESGLATPGTASFGLNFDTSDPSHVTMHNLKVSGVTLKWAVGLSDGTDAPTVDSNGDFVFPSARSWINFNGFMNSYPFSFQQNSVVQSTVGIQVSGEPTVVPKV